MVEGILGEDIKMGEEVFDDLPFLRKVKEICVNNRIKKIQREDLRDFLENVNAILVNKHPNEFVTIKEIANDNAIKEILEKKWNLRSDPDYAVMWFLCHPISYLSPYILCLECRDHADYAQWALKYNPDKQKDYQVKYGDFIQRIRQLSREAQRALKYILDEQKDRQVKYGRIRRQRDQEIYDLTIRAMVEFFPDFEGEEELRKQDNQLDEFEEGQRRLRRSIRDEERGESWRK